MPLERKRACKFGILHKIVRPDFHSQGATPQIFTTQKASFTRLINKIGLVQNLTINKNKMFYL